MGLLTLAPDFEHSKNGVRWTGVDEIGSPIGAAGNNEPGVECFLIGTL